MLANSIKETTLSDCGAAVADKVTILQASQTNVASTVTNMEEQVQAKTQLLLEIQEALTAAQGDASVDIAEVQNAIPSALQAESQAASLADSANQEPARVRAAPDPVKQDIAKPKGAIGMRPVNGDINKAEPCQCQSKVSIRKALSIPGETFTEELLDPASEASKGFISRWAPKVSQSAN